MLSMSGQLLLSKRKHSDCLHDWICLTRRIHLRHSLRVRARILRRTGQLHALPCQLVLLWWHPHPELP